MQFQKFIFFLGLWLLLAGVLAAQETFPRNDVLDERANLFAFTHATIVTEAGTQLADATLLVKDGKIEQVGTQVRIPDGYQVTDLSGKTIYPSFVDLHTNYGIPKQERSRWGSFAQVPTPTKPQARPILLTGATAHTIDLGIHLNWPTKNRSVLDFNTFTSSTKPNEDYPKQTGEIRKHFVDAKAYGQMVNPLKNLKLEAMKGLLIGKKRLFIHANQAEEIIESINLAKESGIENITPITLNPAKALGIDQRVGTLEVGKDATLFVSEGDVLDIRTSILTHAFIRGKNVVLDNKQQALYKRYSEKYGHGN